MGCALVQNRTDAHQPLRVRWIRQFSTALVVLPFAVARHVRYRHGGDNVALADRRASARKGLLHEPLIAASRPRTASYGEEDPEQANEHEDMQVPQSPCGARGQVGAMKIHRSTPMKKAQLELARGGLMGSLRRIDDRRAVPHALIEASAERV